MQRFKMISGSIGRKFENDVDDFLKKFKPEDIIDKVFVSDPNLYIVYITYWERTSPESDFKADNETI